jgi:hypothetical protein
MAFAFGVGWVVMARGADTPQARLTIEKNKRMDRTIRVFRESMGMLETLS